LHEIENPVTGNTFAASEPALDYIVVKIPRWPFDKFTDADRRLGTQMKATGEVMATARSFEGALLKAVRSLPFFPGKLQCIVLLEQKVREEALTPTLLRTAKESGLTDRRIAQLAGTNQAAVRQLRRSWGITPTYKMVDTCAAEFETTTPYYYSAYERENEVPPSSADRVVVLGSGPIRIGQGIEFDYCSVNENPMGVIAHLKLVEPLANLGIPYPRGSTITSNDQATLVGSRLGFPVLVRPSYVLGGRAMRVVHNQEELRTYPGAGDEIDGRGHGIGTYTRGGTLPGDGGRGSAVSQVG